MKVKRKKKRWAYVRCDVCGKAGRCLDGFPVCKPYCKRELAKVVKE